MDILNILITKNRETENVRIVMNDMWIKNSNMIILTEVTFKIVSI